MPDIFDQLASDQSSSPQEPGAPVKGDIFDQLARKSSTIKRPAFRGATASATGTTATPPPASTTPAIPDWLAKKQAIARANIARYPENQPEQLEPIIEPEMGVQMGMVDVGPKAQAAMQQLSPVPQAAMPALSTAKKYAVDPFEKMAAKGAKAGKEMLQGGAAAMVEGNEGFAQSGEAVDPESGLPLPRPESYRPEVVEKFKAEYPRTAGTLGAVGSLVGGVVADPRNYPLFFMGGAPGWAQRAISGGFAAHMGKGAVEQAGELGAVWDRSDVPPEQKAEITAGLILQTLMTGTAGAHATAPRRVPPPHLDPAVQTMLDYEIAHGNIKPPAPPPRPQLALDPEKIAQIGQRVAQLPHADRQGVLVKLHDKLSQAIAEQKKLLGPDGQLRVVNSPAEAQKLAQQIINDSISEHDERVTQRQNAQPQLNRAQIEGTQPRAAVLPSASVRNVPAMGHGMTSDAPAVRRVQAEARPIPGQAPTVKVKQAPARIQAALAQAPAPVRVEEAARIGERDPQSGRPIVQPSNNVVQNERLANQAAPELDTRLSRIAASVPGARFDRLRPQKGLERLQEKVAQGKPPRTIQDNLAAQIVAPSVPAKDRVIARLRREFPVISVEDKFLEPREKAGYPSANVQVQMANGLTAEVQIVAPEIQAITDQTHRLYTQGRNFPEGSAERARYWDQAAALHQQALERFKARNAQELQIGGGPLAQPLAPGQRVVLRNGQTGKIVGVSRNLNRIVVRTGTGLRTVRPREVRSQIEISPKRMPVSPSFNPKDLKFTGKVVSRLGAPGSQRGEIVLLNPDALHEVRNAMKDHSFTGVTLSGDMADDVIARIQARAEKTGREDLDLLVDHMVQARSQYGVLPVALEGSDEAVSVSAELEERIHGGQMDMGKGLIENYGDPEHDYAHPKTHLFLPWLESREVNPNDKVMAVAEIAALILRRGNREAGVSDADAKQWIRSHFRTLREVHGDDAVQQFRRMIHRLLTARRQRRSR